MRSIEEIKLLFSNWDSELTKKQKYYIHFISMKNFSFHFQLIESEKVKKKILLLLNDYIDEVEYNSFKYSGTSSYGLVEKYLHNLSDIYKEYAGFKNYLIFKFVLIFSLIGDVLLYFFLFKQLRLFIPVVSVFLFTYFFYTKIYFERKNKVFGIFY